MSSITKTVETGAFYRTVIRKGKKRKQKTIRLTKNEKKVTLGYIGDFEVYIYPYDYPDTVFIGKFPVSTKIEGTDWRKLYRIARKVKWYLTGEAWKTKHYTKASKKAYTQLIKAYNSGLKSLKNPENSPDSKKSH